MERFLKWSLLRVLDLSSTAILELPSSISDLKHLRYLNLTYSWRMQNLPDSVCDLYYLQSLNLGRCFILNDFDNFVALPRHLGKLINLKTLGKYVVGKETGRGIGELKDMNNLRDELFISHLDNVDSVEEALMADLKRKKTH